LIDPKRQAFYNHGLAFRDRRNRSRVAGSEQAVKYDTKNAVAFDTLSYLLTGAITTTPSATWIRRSNSMRIYGLAYYNRGMAYRAKGEPDRAIRTTTAPSAQRQRRRRLSQPRAGLSRHPRLRARDQDFDQAIRPPTYLALNDRGIAYAARATATAPSRTTTEPRLLDPRDAFAYTTAA
jgi:hypothetical protein